MLTVSIEKALTPLLGILRDDLREQAAQDLDRILSAIDFVGDRIPVTFQSRAAIGQRYRQALEWGLDAGARQAGPPTSPGTPTPPRRLHAVALPIL